MKILSLFLFFLVFVPLQNIFGKINGVEWSITPYYWLLLVCSTACIAWLLNGLFPKLINKFTAFSCRANDKISPNYIYAASIIIFAMLIAINFYCFSQRPLLIDSIVQLFQAEIFANNLIKATRPPFIEFFVTQHMIIDESGWYGQYPPGHSLLLLPFVILGVPWITNCIISTTTFILLFKFTYNVFGFEISKITALLLLICPFFLFMGASHMNHPSALLCLTCFLYFFSCYEKENKLKYLFLCGFFSGFCLLIRPLDVIILVIGLALPFFGILFRNLRNLTIFAFGFSPFFFGSLYYNKITTGDYLLPGYIKLWGSGHGLGFHTSPWGKEHTPITGLRNELVDLQLLQEMLFDWPIPSLTFITIYLFFVYQNKKDNNPWTIRLLLVALAYPAFYFLYWHRDAFLGPRFMYSSILSWLPLTAVSIHETTRYFSLKKIHIFGLLKSFNFSSFYYTTFILCILYYVSVSLPERWNIYRTSLHSTKIDLIKKAQLSNIQSGIIFVKTSWGVRILSELRGLGLSASKAQIAYSNIDHCTLSLFIKESKKEQYPLSSINSRIDEMLINKEILVTLKFNFDATAKINPDKPLARECKEELAYDLKDNKQNYTVYEPHMRSNSPRLEGPFIIAKDLRIENKKLIDTYPHLTPYIYDGVSFIPIK